MCCVFIYIEREKKSLRSMSSFAEKHLQEASTPETEPIAEAASPKRNKRDESDEEEEDEPQSPVHQTPKKKKQLDTCK